MKPNRFALWLALLLTLSVRAFSEPQYAHWTASLQPAKTRAGEHAQVVLTARVDSPWHVYSLTVVPNGPIATSIAVVPGRALTEDGKPVQPKPASVRDPNFNNAVVEFYEGGVAFGLPVRLVAAMAPGAHTATVKLRYQLCKAGACLRPTNLELPVRFNIEGGPVRSQYAAPQTAVPTQPSDYHADKGASVPGGAPASPGGGPQASAPLVDQTSQQIAEAKRHGILNFLLLSFGFGLAALLTPCVFPMIPITVSFFAKTNQEDRDGRPDLRGAFAYSLGIVGTFTVLGLLMTAIFGPLGINRLAQSPWTNLVLAALFIILAANLFGAFEVIVPSWLLDKAQQRKGSGGLIGPFAMGFAFTLTSFTCTVAFVGTLLAAASQGDWFYPALGMLAFSTAFALPFFLLALFPQYLARLPRSGSWMVSVKAFMGFLELAAALKFLSNIDLFLQAGLLTRSVFLAIWSCLAIIAGLYLLGWVRLAVDTSKRFGLPRRTIGSLSILAGLWCLGAINGAPLGTLAAFLPPAPYPYKNRAATDMTDKWVRDWQSGLAKAKTERKPIFINFTGAQCTNCRDMETNVFPRPEVSAELDKFVLVELITDQISEASSQNSALQDQFGRVTTLPLYVITTPEGKPVGAPIGYTKDTGYFLRFLREGFAAANAAGRQASITR